MSQALNGNGNGYCSTVTIMTPPTKPQQPDGNESFVSFTIADEIELRGVLGRMTRDSVIFEIYSTKIELSISKTFSAFTIHFRGKVIYLGRAVIRSLVDTGAKVVCEATLDDTQWSTIDPKVLTQRNGQIGEEFKLFLQEWQNNYTVSPIFKVAVADLQTFLQNLKLWLDRVELQIALAPKQIHEELEATNMSELARVILPLIDSFFEKFEEIAKAIESRQKPTFASYMRRHLHPLVLSAPFANRTFTKPRGYAGDYEMVNMITRNTFEGTSFFSKILHAWFIKQPPAEAHRNRIEYLLNRIESETHRRMRAGGAANIFNFACGPAIEVQEFRSRTPICNHANLTLADFDGETLDYVQQKLDPIQRQNNSKSAVAFQKKSVHQLIKEHRKSSPTAKNKYDLVYCAGLFDYLPDSSCKQLMDIFYEMTCPGGLLIATNVEPSNPLRYGMEYLLDWHLIYRNEEEMRAIRPSSGENADVCVKTDVTGVNLFLEIRKPING